MPTEMKPNRLYRVIFAVSLALNLGVAVLGVMHVREQGGLAYLKFKAGLGARPFLPMPHQTGMAAWHQSFPRTPNDTIFLGDSLTANIPFSEIYSRYKNRGIGADTTNGVLKRLDEVMSVPARQVFVWIGTNDVAQQIPASETILNYRTILQRIKKASPGAQLYVESVLPVNQELLQSLTDRNEPIRQLNLAIKKLADEMGATYIDLVPLVSDATGNLRKEYTIDGLHLTHPANLVISGALRPYVQPDSSSTPTTRPISHDQAPLSGSVAK